MNRQINGIDVINKMSYRDGDEDKIIAPMIADGNLYIPIYISIGGKYMPCYYEISGNLIKELVEGGDKE